MIVYVTTQGAHIVKDGRRLLVKKDGAVCNTLFSHQLEQLILCGNVQVTTQALRLLMHAGIDTVFLTRDGRYRGRLAQEEPKNVLLRQRQFELARDEAFCLRQARRMVTGKLRNMIMVLQRIRRRRDAKAVGQAAERLRRLLPAVEAATGLEVLRGLEGKAAAGYFLVLRHGLDKDFGFRHRVRRPPTDPVNAVLSLLYTFITNRLYTAVRLAGLDPYPGVLHSLDYGRCALPLDLVEEWRPLLADTLMLALFNLGVIKLEDFQGVARTVPRSTEDSPMSSGPVVTDALLRMFMPEKLAKSLAQVETSEPRADARAVPQPERAAVRLYPPAFKRVVAAFEKKLADQVFHPGAERRLSYSEGLVFQARQFRRVIEGKIDDYQPLLIK